MARKVCVCIEWLNDEQRASIAAACERLGFEAAFFMPGEEDEAKRCLQTSEVLFGHSQDLLAAASDQLQWYCCSFAGVDPYCANPGLFANPDCLLTNSSGCYDETIASAGARQAAATQTGIAYIYIFVPILLCLVTIFFTAKFPMNKEEFAVIRREIARRKGEESGTATEEEIAVCEKVTGFRFDQLWKRENALRMK